MTRTFFQAMGRTMGLWRGKGGEADGRDCVAASLGDIVPGEACTICRLHGCGPVRQRLLDLGFQPGREVKVVRNAPLHDPIELQLGDSFIVLRRREAAHIEVIHA
ncbi:MAG: ferrous iron transport protein A [Tropicimonas sp.]|uniref:FeoA family protein n=1 Tax=Tropicimonas sp. TaxID=2067044 RepID=UPI003A85AEF7